MIICNLKGRLGNILFQIAATKALAHDNNDIVVYPNLKNQLNFLSELNNDPNLIINYLKFLKKFNLKSLEESEVFYYNAPFHSLEESEVFYYNAPFHYTPIPYHKNILVEGYFQSEKFFAHRRDYILECFQDKEIEFYLRNKYPILEGETVALHVRRGDYLNVPEHHIILPMTYYLTALKKITHYDTIFVFSDDIPWCKKSFNMPNVFFVEEEKDYIDLYLMSLCKNCIISNSSFSWWGAWLMKNENKHIIAPKKWFGPAKDKNEYNTKDIIPETWRKLWNNVYI